MSAMGALCHAMSQFDASFDLDTDTIESRVPLWWRKYVGPAWTLPFASTQA